VREVGSQKKDDAMNRRAPRKDDNHREIVNALESIGATVLCINEKDAPDLLVGYRGSDYLLEIKDGSKSPSRRKLRPGQERFAQMWRGRPPVKVESIDEAFRAIGTQVR
jgi:Holliday junction resolvase